MTQTIALPTLTQRKPECLQLTADGCKQREIAAQLNISAESVKDAMGRVYLKLGAETPQNAVAIELRRCLIN